MTEQMGQLFKLNKDRRFEIVPSFYHRISGSVE